MFDRVVGAGYIVIREGSQHEDNGIDFSDIGQELVAQAFAFACTFDETANVDDLYGGRSSGTLATPTLGSLVANA
jgi:hypothetical protein